MRRNKYERYNRNRFSLFNNYNNFNNSGVGIMNKIWLVIKNIDKGYTFTKYFESEFEKDKFKRKVKHISSLLIIEDSTDIVYK